MGVLISVQKLDNLFCGLALNKPLHIYLSKQQIKEEPKMQKTKLFAITILAALLLSAVLTVATAQEQNPSGADPADDPQEKTLTGMAIGIGSAIFTVGLIGVLYFRKQE